MLARSLRDHHRDASITVLVLDADDDARRAASHELFDIIGPGELNLDRAELERMAGIYDVLELSTALKPWLLRELLRRDASPVTYLDPDIEIFAPIDEVVSLADEHAIVLTPHTVAPLPLDNYGPNEITILQSGVYNLGFIGVGADAMPFLDWWADRLKRDCLIAKPQGMFVDQKWVDLVPNYFQPHVLRDPGYNVAYWNLPARKLARSAGGYLVEGGPLRFFHYSGFDPDQRDRLSLYQGEPPRIRLAEHPILSELCNRYADELIASGYRAWTRIVPPFVRSSSGLLLDPRARHVYREHLIRHERLGSDAPPNPFERRDPDAFERWLNERVGPHEVTRYLRAFYNERPDVQAAFPDIDGDDARLFVDWVRAEAAERERISERLVPRPHQHPVDRGVNLIGYVAAENGVGEAARLIGSAFEAAGVQTSTFAYRNTRSRQDVIVQDDAATVHDLNVLCINADQLPTFLSDDDQRLCPIGRYRIGVWAWEVEQMPDWMGRSGEHLDEIWTYSEHSASAIRPLTDRPVYVAPPPIVAPHVPQLSRADLGLPDGFLFLFCFDFDSVFERKNPIGVVEAFRRAFPSPTGPQLVIKSVRGEAHPEELLRLRGASAGRNDIHVIDGYLDAGRQHALMAACDAYVSLHRSEGFGLTMAEAMALAKPVVATGYSSNLEFMDSTNSWLVPYTLVDVGAANDPYPPDARWADPDLDAASAMMREIVADPAAAIERGQRAAADVVRLHSPATRVAFVRSRLDEIWRPKTGEGGRFDVASTPWTAADSAAHYRAFGPDVESPTRYGFASRLVRKGVMRVMRHFAQHQDRVHATLLESVRDLQQRLHAETAAVRELEAKLVVLEAKLSTDGSAQADVTEVEEPEATVRPIREQQG